MFEECVKPSFRRPVSLVISAFFVVACLCRAGYSQVSLSEVKEVYNSGEAVEGKPLAAEESLAAFDAPDFSIKTVFAAEPMIQNPIAVNWDDRGRMWLAENFTYAERPQRFDLELSDRVVVLEDDDQDGRADRRTVFLTDLKILTGIEVDSRGVWLMCPPNLLFVPDADQDLKPDGPPQVVLDGFEIPLENYHNFANGLRWGPDGWLYGRCGGSCPARVYSPSSSELFPVALEGGMWRYHPQTKCFESLVHGTTNPWGHDWNEWGELFFINTVNGHFWHMISGAHLDRPFTLDPNPRVYEPLQMHADHWHFDTGKRWTDSRNGVAQAFGGGHAHSGLMFCRGNSLLPEQWQGDLVTWNFHGYQLNREKLVRSGSGYVASHGGDAFHTRDQFARIIDVRQGPDGAMYLFDWCDTGECHEADGVHRTSGRVFRFATHATKAERPNVRWEPESDVPGERERMKMIDEVSSNAQSNDVSLQLKALQKAWTLHRIATPDELTSERLELSKGLFQSSNEHLRAWSVRLLVDHWPIDDCLGLHPIVQQMDKQQRLDAQAEQASVMERLKAAARDPSGLVRLATASALPRLLPEYRAAIASELMQNADDANDHNLPLVVWFGIMNIVETHPNELMKAAFRSRWPVTSSSIVRGLVDDSPDPLRLDAILKASGAIAEVHLGNALLKGVVEGLAGLTNIPMPKNWSETREQLLGKVASSDSESVGARLGEERVQLVRALDLAFDNERAAQESRTLILNPQVSVGLRRSALDAYINSGKADSAEICVKLLQDGKLNSTALKGIALGTAPELAVALIKSYKKFHASGRSEVLEVLCSRESFAIELLRSLPDGPISIEELTAYHQFQLQMLNSDAVRKLASEKDLDLPAASGQASRDEAEQRKRIAELREELSLAGSEFNYDSGKKIFQKQCAGCHRMFGEGGNFGPDLTGGNRNNLEYLLTNLVMPSAEVSPSYQVSTIVTLNGRVLTGVIRRATANALELQSPTGTTFVPLVQVELIKRQLASPMPEGILDQLSPAERSDLIGFLRESQARNAGNGLE